MPTLLIILITDPVSTQVQLVLHMLYTHAASRKCNMIPVDIVLVVQTPSFWKAIAAHKLAYPSALE